MRTEEVSRTTPNKPLILVALLLAAFMINLDTTIVNVALPTLVRKLHASTVQLEWIVDAYNLLFGALVLAAGNLGDRVRPTSSVRPGAAMWVGQTTRGWPLSTRPTPTSSSTTVWRH